MNAVREAETMTTASLTRRQRATPRPLDSGDHPSVTVVIPCHNYARFLPDAVGSALSQAGVIVDVIIVDDASTDESLAVARARGLDLSPTKELLIDESLIGWKEYEMEVVRDKKDNCIIEIGRASCRERV